MTPSAASEHQPGADQSSADAPNRSLIERADLSAIGLAIAITAAQIVVAMLCGRGETWFDRYMSLYIFDGGWYANIVHYGYNAGGYPQANIAFFPGYPVTAGLVRWAFGLSTPIALLVTSQLAAVLFWWALIRMLKGWQVAGGLITAVVMLVFCQPGAFYLVVPYSESIFIASLLILVSFGSRAGQSVRFMIIAAAGGYLLSATRIVGAPLAMLPAIWAWADHQRAGGDRWRVANLARTLWKHSVVSLATAFGGISFFIYCAVRWGQWDAYMQARVVGWGAPKTVLWAILLPENFRLFLPRFSNGDVVRPGPGGVMMPYADYFISATDVSHVYLAILLICLIMIPAIDGWLAWRGRLPGFLQRSAFYLAAWLLLSISAVGSSVSLQSYTGFIRYGLYPFTLVVIALAHAHAHSRFRDQPLPGGAMVPIFLAGAISLALQMQFCWRYAREVLLA